MPCGVQESMAVYVWSRLKESGAINTSLFMLAQVVDALNARRVSLQLFCFFFSIVSVLSILIHLVSQDLTLFPHPFVISRPLKAIAAYAFAQYFFLFLATRRLSQWLSRLTRFLSHSALLG